MRKTLSLLILILSSRDLNSIQGREVCCYSISAKNKNNIDKTLEWLIQHSGSNAHTN